MWRGLLWVAGALVQFGKPASTPSSLPEVAFETYYKVRLARNLNLANDLQYIQAPSGLVDRPNSLVFTPRLVLTF